MLNSHFIKHPVNLIFFFFEEILSSKYPHDFIIISRENFQLFFVLKIKAENVENFVIFVCLI